jgi:hypothetical protein
MNTSYSAKAVAVPASSNTILLDLFRSTPLYLFVNGAKAALATPR